MRAAIRNRLPRTLAGQLTFAACCIALELLLIAGLAHLRHVHNWR